jgi:alkenylglycerophosphocholine/alkenylglycerophosphoethanolamine hydrolase
MKTRTPHNQKDVGTETDLEIDPSARVLGAKIPLEAELLYVGGLGLVLYVIGLVADLHLLRLVAKPWPVVALARWVLAASRTRQRPELTTVAQALFLGASGDLLLEIDPSLFLLGLVAFLLGHLLYVVALHRETRGPAWARALPGAVYVAGMIALLAPRLPATLVGPVAVYAVVLGVVLFRAAARVGVPGLDARWTRLGLLGAVLFTASDSLIAIDRFHTELPGARYLIMASYWAGQGLLALSLVHARRAEDAAPPLPAAYAVDAGVSSTDGSSAPPADPDPSA